MGAILLAPVYILINFYVVRWMIRWMGACHRLFQTMAFRVSFVGIYIILATALLIGFLVKKPLSLHRILKHIGNYFLGTFIYILLVIAVVDFGRLILKYVFHAPFIGQRSTFVITGLICTVLIIAVSIYGILHVANVKTTPYEVTVEKSVDRGYSGQSATAFEQIGLKNGTVAGWKKESDALPASKYLIQLSRFFGVSIDYLVCETDIPEKGNPLRRRGTRAYIKL